MGTAGSRIHHDLFKIRLLERAENRFEVSFLAPVGKASIHVIPMAQGGWQISPRRTGRSDPQQRIQKTPHVPTPTAFEGRKMRFDARPCIVAQSVACHN